MHPKPVNGDFAISGVVAALTFDCQLLARKPVATLEHLTVAALSNHAAGILTNTLEAFVCLHKCGGWGLRLDKLADRRKVRQHYLSWQPENRAITSRLNFRQKRCL